MDALKQCREIIEYNLDSLTRSLGDLITGLANTILDVESEPRKESLKLLSILLSSVSSEIVEPFFNVLCSYLRCGMTHIQSQIQRDSLLLLDSLIEHLPSLIALKSESIFEDFLDMISSSKCDKGNRMLTLNVENKTTNIKWRCEVLKRLHSMLTTVIQYKFNGSRINESNTNQSQCVRFNLKNQIILI
uniref:Pre-rRNA-processing protein Ipi1 N-terminal domain-containing protein n=1 Tax=Megaselia scalaris TaxID=36166 RepID=T1GJ45_MEGSC